jgi:transcription elongation factor SPT5
MSYNDEDDMEYNPNALMGQMIAIEKKESADDINSLEEMDSYSNNIKNNRRNKSSNVKTKRESFDESENKNQFLNKKRNNINNVNKKSNKISNSNSGKKVKHQQDESDDSFYADINDDIKKEEDEDQDLVLSEGRSEKKFVKKDRKMIQSVEKEKEKEKDKYRKDRREKYEQKDQKRKKKSKFDIGNFFEDAAEEDDDEYVENEEQAEINYDEFRKIEKEAFRRKDEKLSQRNIADKLEAKYKDMVEDDEDNLADLVDDGELDEEEDFYNRQPKATEDPKLWLVKCKIGKERQNCLTLLQKYYYQNKSQNLKIFSAFSIDALKGYIYIEAFKEANVREAIAGISTIRNDSIKLVPIEEMTQVLNFDKLEKVDLKKGDWVRIKTGIYEADLAQIMEIEDTALKIYVKIIPRIFESNEIANLGGGFFGREGREKKENINTLGQNTLNKATEEEKENNKKKAAEYDKNKQFKNKMKPKQQFFNPNIHTDHEVKKHPFLGEQLFLWKNKYFKDGFFVKCLKLRSLVYKEIQPKIEELRIFESVNVIREENDENKTSFIDTLFNNIGEVNNRNRNKFCKGEKVKFTTGNLTGITGKVTSHDGTTVKILADVVGLSDELVVPEQYLKRHFIPGDMVVVEKDTRHRGKRGIIVKINDEDTALIFDESTMSEIKVSMNNLILSSKIEKAIVAIQSEFKISDLVVNMSSSGASLTNQFYYIVDIQPYNLVVVDLKGVLNNIASSQVKKINSK